MDDETVENEVVEGMEEKLRAAISQLNLGRSYKYVVARRGKNRHQRRSEAREASQKSGLSTASKAFKARQARKNKRRQARRSK